MRVFSCLTDTTHVFSRFQRKMRFVPWTCGNAMKIGMCSVPPPGLTSSVLSLINTSSMSSLFKDVAQKFNKLYRRKVNMCYNLFYLWYNYISTCWHVFRRCLIWILAYTLPVMAVLSLFKQIVVTFNWAMTGSLKILTNSSLTNCTIQCYIFGDFDSVV
jgi:hypothetical protein